MGGADAQHWDGVERIFYSGTRKNSHTYHTRSTRRRPGSAAARRSHPAWQIRTPRPAHQDLRPGARVRPWVRLALHRRVPRHVEWRRRPLLVQPPGSSACRGRDRAGGGAARGARAAACRLRSWLTYFLTSPAACTRPTWQFECAAAAKSAPHPLAYIIFPAPPHRAAPPAPTTSQPLDHRAPCVRRSPLDASGGNSCGPFARAAFAQFLRAASRARATRPRAAARSRCSTRRISSSSPSPRLRSPP